MMRRWTPSCSRSILLIFKLPSFSSSASSGTVSDHTLFSMLWISLCGGACISNCPCLSSKTSFAINSMSDTICVASKTVRPRENFVIRLRNRILSCGSSPAVGSSKIKMSGSFSMACAMPTRWRIPPESAPIFLWRASPKCTASKSSLTRRLPFGCKTPFSAHIYCKNSCTSKFL
ncbi:hypothetical protein SDC9_121922 [bioreactor metagenome]|uniref:Uncharacterized protein n=1 Tax=bioreactor metagenome TaxID=1076179 RepID=A0A645CDE5_9ZZZZ